MRTLDRGSKAALRNHPGLMTRKLLDAGVDQINTDDLDGFQRFLTR